MKLAQTDVQLGEEVSSIAYWDHRFHVDPVRKIKEISPAQMITSLDIEPNTVREGTCGGPVLNKEGEVIGMHAGNSPRQRIGYVIPVSHIRQALQAYHEGAFEQTLLFNGVNLGTIAINEALSSVQVYEGDKRYWISLARRKKQIDYAHLEKLISLKESATRIVFVIKRTPLSTEQEDQQMHMYLISYDLQTGQVLRSDLNHHPIL